jgi:hypothetical protein
MAAVQPGALAPGPDVTNKQTNVTALFYVHVNPFQLQFYISDNPPVPVREKSSYFSLPSGSLERLEMFQTADISFHSSNLNSFCQRSGRLRIERRVNLANNVCSITDICLNDTICSDNFSTETCTGYRAVGGGSLNCTTTCRGEAHCLLTPANYFTLLNQDWVRNLLKCIY